MVQGKATLGINSAKKLSSTQFRWLWGYAGYEQLDVFGLVNMNARLYDPKLGRLLSVDNYVSDPASPMAYNRYTYALNNPISYVDPSGNHPILVAMAIGAAISAATYTAQSAMAPGGLQHNFNIGDFASTTATGAALGALTWGVGQAAGSTLVVGSNILDGAGNVTGTVTFGMSFAREAGRAVAHGFIGAGFSATQGGDFWTGFVTGSVSAFAGHGLAMGGVNLGKVGGAFFSAGMGAGTSYVQGGDPWVGAGSALMSYLLNQALHDGDPGDGDGKVKHPAVKEGADVTSKLTVIPGATMGYASETKVGKMMGIGGKYVFKASTISQRKIIARDIAVAGKTTKVLGLGLNTLALGTTVLDGSLNGWNPDNIADGIMGVAGYAKGWGWIASTVYFGANEYVKSYTGGLGIGSMIYISVTSFNSYTFQR
ncbi:MAG: RHS repeat-associated core domain-containing protein [Sphingobacteriales bacterium]|nr:MAG: RHS repeat-associated core domain-containing protein [Sphingobacteriales bacterium]